MENKVSVLSRINAAFFSSGKSGIPVLSFFTLVTLFYFYGPVFKNINSVYFSSKGDGIQSYYVAQYHIKYDTEYLRTLSSNYPYGENVFFSAAQPLISNTLKLINPIVPMDGYLVAIINSVMLFSLFASVLVLYFLFRELGIVDFFAIPCAIGIGFLSPQIDRMGGHYTLTYEFAIPLFILLFIKFLKSKELKYSVCIGCLSLVMLLTHFYFWAFFALMASVSLLFWTVYKKSSVREILDFGKHFLIQIIIPYSIISFVIFLVDDATDRPGFPYGYTVFTSNLNSIFVAEGHFYSPFINRLLKYDVFSWEGYAYVGIVSLLVSVQLILRFAKNLLNKNFREMLVVSSNPILNVLFWTSVLALLISFGLPFSYAPLEFLLPYSGPIKQVRAVGRFAWIFFYVINIVAVYKIYWWSLTQKKWLRYLVLGSVSALLLYDAHFMNKDRGEIYANKVTEFDSDSELSLFAKGINSADYQAILPLPYYHIGSENVGFFKDDQIVKTTMVVALKTGLSNMGCNLSRTPLGQTYKSIQLCTEPYNGFEIVRDLVPRKKILILAFKSFLSENEVRILKLGKRISEHSHFDVYEIYPEDFKVDLFEEKLEVINQTKLYPQDGFLNTDSIKSFSIRSFDSLANDKAYRGAGCYEWELRRYNNIYSDTLPVKDKECIVSFWVDNFTMDLMPRTTVEISHYDQSGSVIHADYYNLADGFILLDKQWALIERKLRNVPGTQKINITLWNKFLTGKPVLRLDELFIYPSGQQVFKKADDSIYYNNRVYRKRK